MYKFYYKNNNNRYHYKTYDTIIYIKIFNF